LLLASRPFPLLTNARKLDKKILIRFLSSVYLFLWGPLVKIGYVRVSKSDGSQSPDLQHNALLAAGVEADRIYSDLDSGRKDDRPRLAACLKSLQPGNAQVVWKLDRLGRSLKHLVEVVDDLSQRGVGLKVLAGAGMRAQAGCRSVEGRTNA